MSKSKPLMIKPKSFLSDINDLGYVTHRQQRRNLDYNTFHETTVQGGAVLAATEGRNGCPYPLEMSFHPFCWRWECETRDGRFLPAAGMRHYWSHNRLEKEGT
jgi:hypothetical protein